MDETISALWDVTYWVHVLITWTIEVLKDRFFKILKVCIGLEKEVQFNKSRQEVQIPCLSYSYIENTTIMERKISKLSTKGWRINPTAKPK